MSDVMSIRDSRTPRRASAGRYPRRISRRNKRSEADHEHQQHEREDCPEGVRKPIGERDRAADGFAGEKSDRPQRSVAHAKRGLARAGRREPERVVLQRLSGNPLVVLPTLSDDSLLRGHSLEIPLLSGRLSAPVPGTAASHVPSILERSWPTLHLILYVKRRIQHDPSSRSLIHGYREARRQRVARRQGTWSPKAMHRSHQMGPGATAIAPSWRRDRQALEAPPIQNRRKNSWTPSNDASSLRRACCSRPRLVSAYSRRT